MNLCIKCLCHFNHQNTQGAQGIVSLTVSSIIHIIIFVIIGASENNSIITTYSPVSGGASQLKSRSMKIEMTKKQTQMQKHNLLVKTSKGLKTIKTEKQINPSRNLHSGQEHVNDITTGSQTTGLNSGLAKYLHDVRQTIVKNKFKNKLASKLHLKGAVEIEFIISEVNKIKELKILNSSGHPPLDQSALETIRKISEFPRPPQDASLADLSISVIIEFL